MASTDWYEIYQGYSTPDLAAKLAELRARDTGFTSQTMPSGKAYTAAIELLAAQLASCTRVWTERQGRAIPRVGVASFARFGAANAGGSGMATQVLGMALQPYVRIIGDGTATQFSIEHDLNNANLFVVVRENGANGRILGGTEYAVLFNDDDHLTVFFAEPPTKDQYSVTITTGGNG